MQGKRKPDRRAKEGRRGRSLDRVLMALGRVDLIAGLRSRYGGQIGLAAILLARKEVADLADRLDRILGDALERIEQHTSEWPGA